MTEVIDRSGCSAPCHGNYYAYSRLKCRCPDAREATRLYSKRLREGRNQPGWIDSTGVRRRLQAMQVMGWGWPEIAKRCGDVSGSAVSKWASGRSVTPQVAARVDAAFRQLGHMPAPMGPYVLRTRRQALQKGWVGADAWVDIDRDAAPRAQLGLLDGTGTRRRLQALAAVGWTVSAIGRQRGLSAQWLGKLLGADLVSPDEVHIVREAYEALWLAPAPASRRASYAKGRARDRGWVSALAWDDIDDPNERPNLGLRYPKRGDEVDDVAVAEAMAGRKQFGDLTKAERQLVVRKLVELRRWTDQRVATWLHASDRSVLRIRQELGIAAVPASRRLDAA